MKSSEIGAHLGTVANTTRGFSAKQKAESLAEIIFYIRELELEIAKLKKD